MTGHHLGRIGIAVGTAAFAASLLFLLLAFFRWRHLVLEQWPAGHELASDGVRRGVLQMEMHA